MSENISVDITVNLPEIFITKTAYEKIKNESMLAVKQYGKMIEFVGILYGRFSGHNIYINDIERFPEEIAVPSRTTRQKIMMIPTGGEIATSAVNEYVSQRTDVVGFYHTHPFISATLTGGDKEQLRKLKLFPYLKKLGTIHVISRLKGLGFSATPENPVFYVHVEEMGYVEVKPKITTTLPLEPGWKDNSLYSENIEGDEFAGMNSEEVPKLTGEYDFRGKYIKHNALYGPFSNLDSILRSDEFKKESIIKLNKGREHETDPYRLIHIFSHSLTRELFGDIAGEKFDSIHENQLSQFTLGNDPMVNFFHPFYRNLLKKIIDVDFRYEPASGDNNLKELSLEIIKALDNFLDESMKYDTDIKPSVDNVLIRDTVLFSIYYLFGAIAFQWIGYANYLKEESMKAYNNDTKSYNQYKFLEESDSLGLVLFRGIRFNNLDRLDLNLSGFPNYILNMVNNAFKIPEDLISQVGQHGLSWSKNWEIARSFAVLPENWMEQIPFMTHEQILNTINSEPPFKAYVIALDKVDDILKILEYISKTNHILMIRIRVILSTPLAASYETKEDDGSVQILLDIEEQQVYPEREVILKPKDFKITDNSIDCVIDFITLRKDATLQDQLEGLLYSTDLSKISVVFCSQQLIYYELCKHLKKNIESETYYAQPMFLNSDSPGFLKSPVPHFAKNLNHGPIIPTENLIDLSNRLKNNRTRLQIEVILDWMEEHGIIDKKERHEYFGDIY